MCVCKDVYMFARMQIYMFAQFISSLTFFVPVFMNALMFAILVDFDPVFSTLVHFLSMLLMEISNKFFF